MTEPLRDDSKPSFDLAAAIEALRAANPNTDQPAPYESPWTCEDYEALQAETRAEDRKAYGNG